MTLTLFVQLAAGALKRPVEHDGDGDAASKRLKEETPVGEVKSETAA